MNQLDISDVYQYVEENVGAFHANRLHKINELKLNKVLLRKNPYLFKAKHVLTAEVIVRGFVDAYLSSQEETLFGDFLEGVAVFVCQKVFGGYKPKVKEIEGIDLIFERDEKVYVVEIKSGPYWANSSQLKKMMLNFKAAIGLMKIQYPDRQIVPVNGCSYGKDARPYKLRKDGEYTKLCGQDFWSLISGNETLYTEIIEPLGHQAKQRNEEFEEAYAKVINLFTLKFGEHFCKTDGSIDWEKLVRTISARSSKSLLYQPE